MYGSSCQGRRTWTGPGSPPSGTSRTTSTPIRCPPSCSSPACSRPTPAPRRTWRAAAASSRRCNALDFLDDIAEDLSHGRLGIPHDALARHGLTHRDLAEAGPAARTAFAALVPHQLALVQAGLSASYDLVERVAASGRPLVRALLTLQELRVRTVRRKGAALLTGGTRPPVVGALGLLAREYRAARSQRLPVRA
ncbi:MULTISPECIES: squalene/phytoene synthase family protein [Streptomyces]|uniref:squalene/phytoene synthase family protein n=1 Tax=Streptomyces TaxID=1883 RepID=UPI0022AA5740|nr:squalene/phytoene synthase family protein [Streptomyces sp. 9-7]